MPLFVKFNDFPYVSFSIGREQNANSNKPIRKIWHNLAPLYTNLNTTAKIQTAAIKNDITIRNGEKPYSFSGLNLS